MAQQLDGNVEVYMIRDTIVQFFVSTTTTMMGTTDAAVSAATTIVILLTAAVVVVAVGNYSSKRRHGLLLPKGYMHPPKANIGLIQMMKLFMMKPPYEALREIAQQHVGSYTFRMPILPIPGMLPMVIVVGDCEIARSILKDPKTTRLSNDGSTSSSHAKDTGNGAGNKLLLPYAPLGGPAIITANGYEWEHRRQHINPAFSSFNIKRMTNIVEDLTKEWMKSVLLGPSDSTSSSTTTIIDIGIEMVYLSLKIVCKASFNYDIAKEECDLFLKEWQYFTSEFQPIKVMTNPMKRIKRAFFSFSSKNSGSIRQPAIQITKRIIESYKKKNNTPTPTTSLSSSASTSSATFTSKETNTTVIDMIMTNPKYKNDEERQRDILIFLIAGHDTTAYTVALTLLELSRRSRSRPNNQQYQNEIQKELVELDGVGVGGSIHSWSNVTPLQNCIRESMRLNTVVPHGLPRIVGSDITIQLLPKNTRGNGNEDGGNTVKKTASSSSPQLFIPKGSVAIIATSLIQRNPNTYQKQHEDPNQFVPSRWNTATDEEKRAFMPFGYGKQNCIGQRLAMTTTTTILGLLLKEYKFSLIEEGYLKHGVTLQPVGTLLQVEKRA